MDPAPWYWVRDGSTSVDSAQVSQSAVTLSWASRSALDAAAALTFLHPVHVQSLTDSFVQDQIATSDRRFWALQKDLTRRVRAFQEQLAELAEWTGVAGLIYASAERDSQGFIEACNTLAALDCSLPTSTSLGAVVSKAGSYVRAMGSHSDSRSPLVAGLQAQTQFAGLAQGSQGANQGRSSTSGLASLLGGVWTVARWITWGDSNGVVVSGGGASAWAGTGTDGSLTQVSLGGPGKAADWPQGWADRSHPVPTALDFLAEGQGDGAVGDPPSVPLSASALLAVLPIIPTRLGAGQIHILKHSGVDPTRPSWSVVIKGTQTWLPGTSNPQDMRSNLQEVAGTFSDQQVAVLTAMDLAGIRPGDPVELVGHSQGGAVALSIAENQELLSKYNIVAVLTAGAPATASPSLRVPVLALENTADVVPALDGEAALANQSSSVIYFDDRSLVVDAPDPTGAHSIETYIAAARRLEEDSETDVALGSLRQWNTTRLQAMGLGAVGVTTTSTTYLSRRTRGTVKAPAAESEPTGSSASAPVDSGRR